MEDLSAKLGSSFKIGDYVGVRSQEVMRRARAKYSEIFNKPHYSKGLGKGSEVSCCVHFCMRCL